MDTYILCDVCGFEDTKVSNGDCDACSECWSIEQGFTERDSETGEVV